MNRLAQTPWDTLVAVRQKRITSRRLSGGLAALHARLLREIGEASLIASIRDPSPEPIYCSSCDWSLRAPPSRKTIAFAETYRCGFTVYLCAACRRKAKSWGRFANDVLASHDIWHEVQAISNLLRHCVISARA